MIAGLRRIWLSLLTPCTRWVGRAWDSLAFDKPNVICQCDVFEVQLECVDGERLGFGSRGRGGLGRAL